MTKLVLPEEVKTIIKTLQDNGFEGYSVGGCVRDVMLDRIPMDWDITTSAKPEEVKALFVRTIDTGIQHGTVTVLMNGVGYEVTTYRVDGEYVDHRHPKEVNFTSNLVEDLKRRDFTINAMAYNDESGVIDCFEGQEDLEKKVVRAVGNPLDRFDEDALRMLRAVRFAAQLDFQIEEETKNAITEKAETLSHVSAERIRVELEKLIKGVKPELLFMAKDCGLTKVFFPEFDKMCETEQNNPHHCYDVAMHSIQAIKNLQEIAKREQFTDEKVKTMLAFAALLHDVAKPECLTYGEDGVAHFYKHGPVGEKMAKNFLQRLRFDNDTIRRVSTLIKWHDERYDNGKYRVRQVMSRIGKDNMPYLLALQEADLLAQSDYMREEKMKNLMQAKQYYLEVLEAKEAVCMADLALKGKDLMELGIEPGPKLGETLHMLLNQVLLHPEYNTRETLTELVEKDK